MSRAQESDTSTFASVASRLPVVTFRCTPSGKMDFISPRWEALAQQPIPDALGEGWLRCLHPDDRDWVRAQWAEVMQGTRERELEHRLVRPDGRVVWVRVLVAPFLEAGVATAWEGLFVDTSTQHSAEQYAKSQAQRAGLLEARNQALEQALPDLYFTVDAQGRYADFHGPEEMLLRRPDEFMGQPVSDVLPREIAEKTAEAAARALATGQLQLVEYQLDVPALGRRDWEARISPMHSGEYLMVVRDVSEQRRFQRELIETRERALEASRLKTQFLANVSHEIRTPLNGILGVTQLMRAMVMPRELEEYVGVLQQAGESLLGIVNDVLDLSKIEANRLELESVVFDPENAIQLAVRAFAPQAQKKGVALTVQVEPQARGTSRGDPTRVQQVVNNLVGNALKFTDEGSITVALDRPDAGDLLTLSVRDTGPGIAPERQVAIFEAFVQADGSTARRYGGTGLGLTICRRLCELMGGTVVLESRPGQGSTFRASMLLPRVVIDRDVPAVSSRITPPPRPLRVLLAEDNDVNARMTAALIEKLGHHVEVVTDGQKAVDGVLAGGFDLVLMDVQMPVLDGLQATRFIRQAERGQSTHVPIVALTANAMRGDDLLCLSAGMDAYLPKPVALETLKDMLVWFGSRG
jgi:PAS domain S-box-containing protein